MRFAALALGAVLMLPGCSPTFTTVRTVTPGEYAAQSWIGHKAEDVALAWGENRGGEPDGDGGQVLTYRKVHSYFVSPAAAADGGSWATGLGPDRYLPQVVAEIDELAKFWIGADGKVYRFWFADEVFMNRLDAPDATPVDTYGRKTR